MAGSVQKSENRPRLRPYLGLDCLDINELPPHPEFPSPHNENGTSLAQFLNAVLIEVANVDFDNGWTSHGEWHPEGMVVAMPVLTNATTAGPAPYATTLEATENRITTPVQVSVDQRVKVMNKATWLARTSYHLDNDVTYSELNELLSQDHSPNEARYTPSVYDANELLTWTPHELEMAVGELCRERNNVQTVQMSIYQMFHKMPTMLGGLSLLDDRVFHVLVISVQSTYPADSSSEIPQSCTIQLPINFESLQGIDTIKQRSHIKKDGLSYRYYLPSDAATSAVQPLERVGKKLTEGNYVSLERLQKATKEAHVPPKATDQHHRWDMMTLSTANGITRIAPKKVTHKETLIAIATDVHYVIKHIAEARQMEKNRAQSSVT